MQRTGSPRNPKWVGVCLALLLGVAPALTLAKPLLLLGNAQIAPIVFQRGTEAQGVAVDLTRAALVHAGLQAELRAQEWQSAQKAVQSGEADGLMQINPNPEREKIYDFSDVLLDSHFHLFVPTGSHQISDLASLDGKRVGVEGGGFPITFLKPHSAIVLVTVPSWHRAFEMLRDGQLDAVFVDRWVGEYELSVSHIDGVTVLEPPLVSSQSRIAVRKGQAELLARINAGLASIQADGTRQAILERWQGKQVVYVTRQAYEQVEWLLSLAAIALLLLILGALVLHARSTRRRNAELLQAQEQLKLALDIRTQALQEATQAKAATEIVLAEQRAVLGSDFIGLLRSDLQSRTLLWTNNAACRMLGYPLEGLAGLPTRVLFASEEDYLGFGQTFYPELRGGGPIHVEVRLQRRDGSVGWYQISASLLKEQVAVAAIVDVTERKVIEDEAAYLAYFDPLTGLANRRMLSSRITLALAQSKRSERHGALMFLDLDNFKPLNDRHGHEFGDLMLKEVARRLQACVRETDTVARFGGDEFVVLLGELDGDAQTATRMAEEVAEKIRKCLSLPYALQPPPAAADASPGVLATGADAAPTVVHHASASVGVALFRHGQPGASELLMRGDAAMYAAKSAGRNRVAFAPEG